MKIKLDDHALLIVARRQLKEWRQRHAELQQLYEAAQKGCTDYRARASRAESEAADWRKRFDRLLDHIPRLPREPMPFFPVPGSNTCMFCGKAHEGLACPSMAPTSSSAKTGAHQT